MLTLPQIIRRTNKMRKHGAKYVRILDVKKGYNSIGQGFIACVSYSTHIFNSFGIPIRNRNPSKYVTVITFLDRRLHVRVACGCPDFKFTHEFVLHEKEAADIEYSNGEPPDIRNPSHKIGTCKHLIALYEKKLKGKVKGL